MLLIVFLTALGVGGITMLGSLAGYCCRGATKRFSGEAVMSFAAVFTAFKPLPECFEICHSHRPPYPE